MQNPQHALRREHLLLAADGVAMFGTWIDFLAILTLAAYRFAVSPYQMALFSAAGILPGIVLAPWVGRWCDRSDVQRTLLASIALRIATTAAVMLCRDLALLTLLVALRSALAAVVAPAVNVMGVRGVEAARRPRFYALLNVLNSSAKVTAPALGTIASSLVGEAYALAASIVLALISLLLFALVRTPPPATAATVAEAPNPRLAWRAGVGLLLATASAYAWFVFMVNNLMPLVLQRSGFDKALLGVLISCSGAGNIVSGLWLARRAAVRPMQGHLSELLMPAAASAAAFFAIGLALVRPHGMAPVLAVVFAIGGLFSARFAVATNVYLARRHADAIGHVSALMQGCQNAMILIAPLVGAVVLDRHGPAALFFVSAGTAVVALASIRLAEALWAPAEEAPA